MRAQTFATGESMDKMKAQKTLELNPRHPIISSLLSKVQASPEDQTTKDLAMLVYDIAGAASGFAQEDIESYSERMYRTIAATLEVDSMELEDELEVPEEAEDEVEAE